MKQLRRDSSFCFPDEGFSSSSSSSNNLIQILIEIDLKKDIFDEVIMIPEQSVEEVKKILLVFMTRSRSIFLGHMLGGFLMIQAI